MDKTDGYVVSRTYGGIVVTALGDPPRDLGSFALPARAAAVILTDAVGHEAADYAPRLARDLLASLEDRQAATYVTIRVGRLESWLGTLDDRWRRGRNLPPRRI
jgi:hypothetical protein